MHVMYRATRATTMMYGQASVVGAKGDRDWRGDHNWRVAAQALARAPEREGGPIGDPRTKSGSGLSACVGDERDRRWHRVVKCGPCCVWRALHARFIKTSPFREGHLLHSLGLQRDPNYPPYRIRLPLVFLCHQQTRMRCALMLDIS